VSQAVINYFSAKAQNEASRKQADAINKKNKRARNFTNKNQKRQFKFDKESIKIQRKNIEQEYAFSDAIAQDNYRYQMQIQAYDFANQMRAYDVSKRQATQQVDFNRFAFDYAMMDTARWEQEQNVMLDFEEKSTMMEFRHKQLGFEMDQRAAQATYNQTRAQGQSQNQLAYIEALKNMGEAVAKGSSGVTGEKIAQSSIAEAGLRTSAIIDELFSADQTFGLSMLDINQKLEMANNQFYLDRAQLAASRVSLAGQAAATRTQAALNKYQADINAISSVMLQPLPPVPLPSPRALPRPILQDPKRPKKLPKVVEVDAQYTDPWLAGLGGLISDVSTAASFGAFG